MRGVREVEPGVYKLPSFCLRIMLGQKKNAIDKFLFGKQRDRNVEKKMEEVNYVRVLRSQDNDDEGTYIRMMRSPKDGKRGMYAPNIFPRVENDPSENYMKAGLYELPSTCIQFLIPSE